MPNFWKLAPFDVEAQVRRLKRAQTLVQDPAHQTQLITATFGKLPSEPDPALGPGGENITTGQSVGGEVDGRSGRIGAV